MEISKTFMNHPFWTQLMSIQSDLPSLNDSDKSAFLQLVVEGFYPISYYSHYSFKQFAKLTPHSEAKTTAQFISDTELGLHPLLGDVPYKGIPHYQQINLMLASLNQDPVYELSHPEKYAFFTEANAIDKTELQALAYCNLIEHTAVWVIHYYQEFLSKWQSKYKVSNHTIFRVYLDEHNLTEGDEAEDQHINMLNKMNGPYNTLIGNKDYQKAIDHLNKSANTHFDGIMTKIEALTQKPLAA
jgi:hypothetical protein